MLDVVAVEATTEDADMTNTMEEIAENSGGSLKIENFTGVGGGRGEGGGGRREKGKGRGERGEEWGGVKRGEDNVLGGRDRRSGS